MIQRIYKSRGSQSRKIAWKNAKAEGVSRGTHIYIGSEKSIDFFRARDNNVEIGVRNITFNNGGL